jgi:hypothetical protein
MIDGTMFDESMLDQFHRWSAKDKNVITDDVRVAYHYFIDEFVSIVSPEWRKYLNTAATNQETATFVNKITTSDEAYAWWFIKIKYSEVIQEVQKIKKIGLMEWKKDRPKKKRKNT